MAKIIIGLVSQLAGGKETTKNYLIEKYGATGHRFSTILREVLERLYLPVSRKNMQDLSLTLRQTFGQDLLAKIIVQDVMNDPNELVVVDGIRRLPDIAYLKDLPGFRLLRIETAEKIRYDRMVRRNENAGDADKTLAQFLADGQKEAELQIPEVMASAELSVKNNGSLTEFYVQLDAIIKQIKNL
jgi:dephospho-CoA kinase